MAERSAPERKNVPAKPDRDAPKHAGSEFGIPRKGFGWHEVEEEKPMEVKRIHKGKPAPAAPGHGEKKKFVPAKPGPMELKKFVPARPNPINAKKPDEVTKGKDFQSKIKISGLIDEALGDRRKVAASERGFQDQATAVDLAEKRVHGILDGINRGEQISGQQLFTAYVGDLREKNITINEKQVRADLIEQLEKAMVTYKALKKKETVKSIEFIIRNI